MRRSHPAVVVMGALLSAAVGDARAATGGPDAFGYTWRDTASGATYSWYDASVGGAPVPLTDDQNTGFIALPFPFSYYGTSYNQVAACSNGWASFVDATNTSYTNVSVPDAGAPNALMAAFWDDLYDATLYTRTFGTAPNRAFVIEWLLFPDCCATTNPKNTFEIVLFEGSNRIRYQYLTLDGDRTSCSIGIENAAGSVGLECLQDNVPVNGFALANGYAVEFLPPSTLDCSGATVVACDSTSSGQAMGAADVASSYGCAAGTYDGNERIYRLDLAATQNVDVSIAGFGADDLDVFLLDACSTSSCLAGGSDSVSRQGLAAGTYYIVVDGATTADDGPFDLIVGCEDPLSCASAPALACDATTSGTTIGQPSAADQYTGVNGTFLGSESVYALTLPVVQNVDIYLEGTGQRRASLFLLTSGCNVNNVIEGGVDEIHIDSLAAGTYYVVVDGRTPADDGAFDIRLVCNDPAPPLVCSGACTSIFSESFTAGIPATWSIVDGGNCTGAARTWTAANPGARPATAPITTPFAIVDSDFAGTCTMDETLISPVIDASGAYSQIRLKFDHYFQQYASGLPERGEVRIRSTATGGAWQTLVTYTTTSPNPQAVDLDVTAFALNQTNVQVSFLYTNASFEWYWMVDNVQLCGVPIAAGLDCSSATPLPCGATLPGNTAGPGLGNGVVSYACGVDRYDGDEQVFVMTLAAPTMVDVAISQFGQRQLDVFILGSCGPCACLAGGGDTARAALQPGTYYIVVDGFTQADNGPFEISASCTSCSDPGFHNRWTSCENPRAPITPATTSAFEWNFDDCDYCRLPGNPCFTTPCTFDMYIVAECGTVMHMPLYDNETGHLRIWDFNAGQYVFLQAQSTGGWTASGTQIDWQDCSGTDPRWNDQTTDVWFGSASGPLCGIYRAEFINWGGFVWDLFSNCTGTDDPGFRIYDSYCEALASYDPYPALSVEDLAITGSCPNYTVTYDVSNAGCRPATTTVVATSSLGGSTEQTETNILPGETRSGSMTLSVQSSGSGTITAYSDFYDGVVECFEAGGSATACSVSGGNASLTMPVTCGCIIPQFANVTAVDLACPVGIRLTWLPATFGSGTGHYDVYRSTISFADAVASPPLATLVTGSSYDDNATTPGTTYYYVVRAEDAAATVPPCLSGPHGGAYTDVNAGPVTDNLSQTQDKPYDIGNHLRESKLSPTQVRVMWPGVVPDPNTTHWHVYRSPDASATFPDSWSMIAPERPLPGWLPPAASQWDDLNAAGPLLFYDVRSANDCEDISPGNLRASILATSPSCSGSGSVSFTAQVAGGVPPFAYIWSFGDGTPNSSAPSPTHVYAYPPYSRLVTLTVTDASTPASQVAVAQTTVTFGPPVTAAFTYTTEALTVSFNGIPGGGSGGYTYLWNFGDNQTSTLQSPVHTYASQGTYTVTFTVRDAQSLCEDTDTKDVTP